MRKINITKSTQKFLLHTPPKHGRQISAKLFQLRTNPHPNDAKQLTGYEHLWRVTAGEYRIVYRVQDETLYIEIIGKRNYSEVYKKLK